MPLVSVIIPAYNAERYLEKCLKSVLAQTLEDIEVFLVDDGSSDNTLATAELIASEDERLHVLLQENSYAGVARNNGMKHATGKYLYFLDADDYVEKNMLERMVNVAEGASADIVVCRAQSSDEKTGETKVINYAIRDIPIDQPIGHDLLAKKAFWSFVGWPWDKLFRADFIRERGLLFQDTRTTNDALFVFSALCTAKRAVCIDDVLVNHRVNNLSSLENTRRHSWGGALEAIRAIRASLIDGGVYRECADSYRGWVANFTWWQAYTLDSEIAQRFLEETRPLLASLDPDGDFYFEPGDREWVRHAQGPEVRTLLEVADLRQKMFYKERELSDMRRICDEQSAYIKRLEEERDAVYASHSYRIGNALISPLSSAKKRLHRENE